MIDRESVEKLAGQIRSLREEAEAMAAHAAENLVRLASGVTKFTELDPDQIRAAADGFAGAVERLCLLTDFSRQLRALLM